MKRALLLWFGLVLFCSLSLQAQDGWSYRGEITGKGTRSEGFVGRLIYGDKEVPSPIAQVVTPVGEYSFDSSGAYPWARRGWLKVSTQTPLPQAAVAFDASAGVHWYRDGKRPNTPRHWVYLPRHRYWLDPNYLQQFAASELKALSDSQPPTLEQLANDVAPSPKPGAKESDSGVFVYKQFIAGRGTKSAGLRGALLYEGLHLQRPGTLKTPIGTFHNQHADLPWHPQGWFPAEEVVVKDTAVSIDPTEVKKGFYKGPRKAGTPSDWCYAPDDDTWYSPSLLR